MFVMKSMSDGSCKSAVTHAFVFVPVAKLFPAHAIQ